MSHTLKRTPGFCQALPEDTSAAERVGAVVCKAWSSVIGEDSYKRNETWDEAAGDSLMALHLLFVIERELSRSVSHDVLGPATRPSDLAAALLAKLGSEPPSNCDPALPLIVLAPGIAGDDAALVAFRDALRGHARCILLRYPSSGEMARRGCSFTLIVETTLSQVLDASADGETIHLLGYSYGALVVRQLAALLPEHHRQIGMLGMIDGFGIGWATVPTISPRLSPFHDVMRGLGLLLDGNKHEAMRSVRQAVWAALMALLSVLPLRALPFVPAIAKFSPVFVAVSLNRTVDKYLRAKAIEGVLQMPFEHRAVVFASSDFAIDPDTDMLPQQSSSLVMVPIGGSHASMLKLPLRSILVDEVIREMTSSMAAARQCDNGGAGERSLRPTARKAALPEASNFNTPVAPFA